MTQEAERQCGVPTNPAQTRSQRSAEAIQIGRAVIRGLARFDVAPQRLDRVQVGSVGGQAFDREPGALASLDFHATQRANIMGGQGSSNRSWRPFHQGTGMR
jgi:hypothetical protein